MYWASAALVGVGNVPKVEPWVLVVDVGSTVPPLGFQVTVYDLRTNTGVIWVLAVILETIIGLIVEPLDHLLKL